MKNVMPLLTEERPRFLAFVQRRVRDPAAAEDILQTAYANAVRQIGSLKASESSEAWFYRILRNVIIDHYRHRAVEERAFAPMPEHEPAAPRTDDNHLCPCMSSAIQQVRPAYRQILEQVELDETPLQGFARQAGITPGAAAVRAHRARTALHRQLVRRCGSCADHAGCLNCTCAHA